MERDSERIRRAAALLREAERPVRVLRMVAWEPEVRERFLAAGGRELPQPVYRPLDPDPTLARVAEARRDLAWGRTPADDWLLRLAGAIDSGARMLAAVGTAELHRYSRELYGWPTAPLLDQANTALGLARQLDEVLSGLAHVELSDRVGYPDADQVADTLRRAVARRFGPAAPAVVVVDQLSANAIAGPDQIRIRRGARFTDRDVHQLIHHEAFVHVATSLNGRDQTDLPILAAAHPGTTRTQEGLAVFAELITGSLDPDRLQRLAERVLAIDMAIRGADFLQVYRFFLERSTARTPPGAGAQPSAAEAAFDNARRVFRGGVLTGGAPFTKDGVYLEGLLRVHNFLRAAVTAGRSDCLRLLFCGKLDLEDIPALCHLVELGLCRMPRWLPPWAEDLRFLVAYLAYSSFLNRIDLHHVRSHVAELLAEAPIVKS